MAADALIEAARTGLRIASPMRRRAFLDMLATTLDLTPAEATDSLDVLVNGGDIVVRGHGTSALVYACPKLVAPDDHV